MRGLYSRLMTALGAAAGIIILVVVVLVTFDIIWRNVGRGSFPWIVEITEYSLPLTTFLAAPWLLYKNEHIRLDIVLVALRPALARACEVITDLLGLAISATLFWYGIKVTLDSARLGSVVLKTLVFPEWWVLAPAPACFLLLLVEFVRRLARGPIPGRSGPAAFAAQE